MLDAQTGLYPQIQSYSEKTFSPEPPHQLYIARYGTQGGIPVISVHGGPGSGSTASFAQHFDPKIYDILVYDQRGAGKSLPTGSLVNNTTQHLIGDLNAIQNQYFGDQKILVWGGSWGSTLALLYAEKYPEQVSGLILRGIFLGQFSSISAFLKDNTNAAKTHPTEWRALKATAFPDNPDTPVKSPEEFQAFIEALYVKLSNEDSNVWQPVAMQFAKWEYLNSFTDEETYRKKLECIKANPSPALTMGRIEPHYMKNSLFMSDNEILNGVNTLLKMPIWIVQGQQDDVCPPDQAEALIEALQTAGHPNLRVARTQAGHSAAEPNNLAALVLAGQEFSKTIQPSIQPANQGSPGQSRHGFLAAAASSSELTTGVFINVLPTAKTLNATA